MTDTVIEKMAMAAWLSVTGSGDASDWPDTGLSVDAGVFRSAARAALLALRYADDVPMRMAGRNAILSGSGSPYEDYSVTVGRGFRAMIDHVLQETDQ